MQRQNYQVIKGRCISFIASKGVYVNDSNLGYSLEKINATIEQKPAAVKLEIRILLLPDVIRRNIYRIVFGRIISWLVLLVIATYFIYSAVPAKLCIN